MDAANEPPHPRFSRQARDEIHRRRGRPLDLPPIDAARTALLVVDMQVAFVGEGQPLETAASRAIVGPVNRLASSLREAGGTVVWIGTTLAAPGSPREWSYVERFVHPGRRGQVRECLRPGHEAHAFWPGLDMAAGDPVCHKDRFSPFSPGASGLDELLKARGAATVLVAGTVTNVCCESTARDAMMLGYEVVMVEDANAADSDEAHLAALANVAEVFGTVVDTGEVIAALAAGRR